MCCTFIYFFSDVGTEDGGGGGEQEKIRNFCNDFFNKKFVYYFLFLAKITFTSNRREKKHSENGNKGICFKFLKIGLKLHYYYYFRKEWLIIGIK